MSERIKISNLELISSFDGDESVPIVSDLTNKRALMSDMKEFFRDSTLVMFDDFDDTNEVPIAGSTDVNEEGVTLSIVFMTNRNTFAMRRRKEGAMDSYFSHFNRWKDYKNENMTPRTDKVFFCLSNRSQYTFVDGKMHDPYTPILLTQDEFDALETKDENRTYYIYEEE
jgi:hypothetical protein